MRTVILLLVLALGGPTSISAAEQPLYIRVGEVARAPIGWIEFCFEHKSECALPPSAPRDIVLTPEIWSTLVRVNKRVNDSINPLTDSDHWDAVERWSYPDDGYGDCEDYVLLKRRTLIQMGAPREALLITFALDKKGGGHAVLTVKTTRGEFVLDNQTDEVLAWHATGLRFIKRQSQGDPNVWVSLHEPPVVTGSR